MKEVLKENRDRFKDTLKYARKLVNGKKDIITFQLTDMPDRLPVESLQSAFQVRGLTVQCPPGH